MAFPSHRPTRPLLACLRCQCHGIAPMSREDLTWRGPHLVSHDVSEWSFFGLSPDFCEAIHRSNTGVPYEKATGVHKMRQPFQTTDSQSASRDLSCAKVPVVARPWRLHSPTKSAFTQLPPAPAPPVETSNRWATPPLLARYCAASKSRS